MESPKNIKWEPTNNRFVGFFDIMGFKDFVYKNDHEKALERVKLLVSFNDSLKKDFGGTPIKLNNHLRAIVVSDSVIISTKGNSQLDFTSLLAAVGILIKGCLSDKVPIKGALSYGKFTYNEQDSLYVGKPLIDAAHLESTLEFYGCIIDHNIEAKIEGFNMRENLEGLMTRVKIPTKEGPISYKVLVPMDYDIETNISNFYSTVSGKARRYVDNSLDVYNSKEMQKIRPRRE